MNRQLDEEKMWKMAEKRIAFKRHAFTYAIVNIFLIGLWYFTDYRQGDTASYWFIYPLFGWGIGLAFNYWAAYRDDISSIDKEYQKIKEQYGDKKDDNA